MGLAWGGGVTILHGDVDSRILSPAGRVNLEYNVTPYINLGLEGQFGKLSAGKEQTPGRYTRASFSAANVNVRFASGQFFRKSMNPGSLLGGLYIGIGVGMVQSKIDAIGDRFESGLPVEGIVKEPSPTVAVPLNVGWNLELPGLLGRHNIVANVNVQYNFVNGEELDGYAYAASGNLKNDGYSLFSIGLKYNFGQLSGR